MPRQSPKKDRTPVKSPVHVDKVRDDAEWDEIAKRIAQIMKVFSRNRPTIVIATRTASWAAALRREQRPSEERPPSKPTTDGCLFS